MAHGNAEAEAVAAVDDSGWPPNDIPSMIQEMCRDLSSPHWVQLRSTVKTMAHRYSNRAATSLDDADDIAQECLAKICKPGKLEAFVARAPLVPPTEVRAMFYGWLSIITQRTWIERKRYDAARPSIAAPPQRASPDEKDMLADIPAPVSSPEEIIQMSAWLKTIFAQLDTISARGEWEATKVIWLRAKALEGMSIQEIARKSGVKEPRVRDAIRNIREQLVRLRQSYDGEPPPSKGDRQSAGQRKTREPKQPKSSGRSIKPMKPAKSQQRKRSTAPNDQAPDDADRGAGPHDILSKGGKLQ